MLGLFTRPVAFILSGQMAVAYWVRWAPLGFWASLEGNGEVTIFYCFFYLFLFAAGGGAWSLDNILRDRQRLADSQWIPYMLGITRIIIGFLITWHGMVKVFGYPTGSPMPLSSLMGIAGALEFFGGLLIIAGLCSRPTALILAGEMALAFLIIHLTRGFWTVMNGGEPALFYCFFFLFVSAAGPGRWSLDGFRKPIARVF